MKIIITEQQKEELFNKYSGNTDNRVLNYLKRHFPVSTYVTDMDFGNLPQLKFRHIFICGKSKNLDDSKKYLVGAIFNCMEDEFKDVDKEVIRRTIKKYLDICRVEY
jgi:hypothetical protein